MVPISVLFAWAADFRVFKTMGLSVACRPFLVRKPFGFESVLPYRYKALVQCLLTYVDFFVSNITLGLSHSQSRAHRFPVVGKKLFVLLV
jgi:hypothetical protein